MSARIRTWTAPTAAEIEERSAISRRERGRLIERAAARAAAGERQRLANWPLSQLEALDGMRAEHDVRVPAPTPTAGHVSTLKLSAQMRREPVVAATQPAPTADGHMATQSLREQMQRVSR